MEKTYRPIDEQVRILVSRGVACDDETPRILLREGYYAVVNGYNQPFLDEEASAAAGEDRFAEGTSFADLYALFSFDRELRAATFRALMEVEGTMRSLLAHCFCEVHRGVEDYLRPTCYVDAARYLRGRDAHEGDLEWMVRTLEHHAHDHQTEDVRVAWYQVRHGHVPLWILMGDLTFGNLKYFFALMRPEEQRAVAACLKQVSGQEDTPALDPRDILADLYTMVDVRNVCAHEERLYNARVGEGDTRTFADFMVVVETYLTPGSFDRLCEDIRMAASRALGGRENPALLAAVESVVRTTEHLAPKGPTDSDGASNPLADPAT